jgi:hypothetical protein
LIYEEPDWAVPTSGQVAFERVGRGSWLEAAELVLPWITEDREVMAEFLLVVVALAPRGFEAAGFGFDGV